MSQEIHPWVFGPLPPPNKSGILSGTVGVKLGIVCCLGYDKKSDEGSNSVRMRHENSGASTVVENLLPTRVSDSSDAQLSDYV